MPERPRIVWDALALRRRPTGVGVAMLELARALATADRGCDFTILTVVPELFDFLTGMPAWRVRACPEAAGGVARRALWTQAALPRLLRRLGADVLHSQHFVAPLRAPCPVVLTVHDLAFLSFPRTVETVRGLYYRLLVPRSLTRADRILASSRATAAEIERRYPRVRERVRVAPLGAPTWATRRPPPPGERDPDAALLFVGNLEPRKNLERLLRAYARVLASPGAIPGPVPDLLLVGPRGWRDARLRRLAEPLRAAGKLRETGYCDREQLWRLYGTARALLFPSLQEGFGFPILEAMAANLPVLTSDRSSMREIAGGAALLVDPESVGGIEAGLRRLLAEPELAKGLVAAGRRRLQEWTWERTAAAVTAAYGEALAGGRAAN